MSAAKRRHDRRARMQRLTQQKNRKIFLIAREENRRRREAEAAERALLRPKIEPMPPLRMAPEDLLLGAMGLAVILYGNDDIF